MVALSPMPYLSPELFLEATADADVAEPEAYTGAPCRPRFVFCPTCFIRAELLGGMTLTNTRCDCGWSFVPYRVPHALRRPAPRWLAAEMAPYWLAGREDGYWEEERWLRGTFEQAGGVHGLRAWRAYCGGRMAGLELRGRALAARTTILPGLHPWDGDAA